MKIVAIDPGSEKSAYMQWDGDLKKVISCGIVPNQEMFDIIKDRVDGTLVIEEIASYGMPVGREVFQTVRWAGRYEQYALSLGYTITYLTRHECKINICHSSKAKDSNIRQALIDRFGVQGTKKKPGPLYGVTADKLAALAVAVTYCDKFADTLAVFKADENLLDKREDI